MLTFFQRNPLPAIGLGIITFWLALQAWRAIDGWPVAFAAAAGTGLTLGSLIFFRYLTQRLPDPLPATASLPVLLLATVLLFFEASFAFLPDPRPARATVAIAPWPVPDHRPDFAAITGQELIWWDTLWTWPDIEFRRVLSGSEDQPGAIHVDDDTVASADVESWRLTLRSKQGLRSEWVHSGALETSGNLQPLNSATASLAALLGQPVLPLRWPARGSPIMLEARHRCHSGEPLPKAYLDALRASVQTQPNESAYQAQLAACLLGTPGPGTTSTAANRYEAQAAANRAVVLKPEGAFERWHQARGRWLATYDLEGAQSDLSNVLAVWPNHAPAMGDLALVLALSGRDSDAVALLERAQRRDPSAAQTLLQAARIHYLGNRSELAASALNQLTRRDRSTPQAELLDALIQFALGHEDAANQAAGRAVTASGGALRFQAWEKWIITQGGQRPVPAVFRPPDGLKPRNLPLDSALFALSAGNPTDALTSLKIAARTGDPDVAWIRSAPAFARFRAAPGVASWLRATSETPP